MFGLKSAWIGILLLLPLGVVNAQGPPRRTAYASACGSEMGWFTDLEAAKAASKKQKKPIFWFVPTAYRTFMDRKQELYWNMMAGPFSDPEIVTYIKERFIPLKMGFRSLIRRGKELSVPERKVAKKLAAQYDLVQGKFIEPGFILLNRSGKAVHTIDRLLVFQRNWFLNRLDVVTKKNKSSLGYKPLASKGAQSKPLVARNLIGQGKLDEALKFLDTIQGEETPEAEWLRGVCHHMKNETTQGNESWKALIEAHEKSIWASKAKVELDGFGPFLHGFESYRDFSRRAMNHKDLRHSRTSGSEANQDQMVVRGLRRILDMQREDGSWDDSRYDFGGLDSMPNVHVAVTAIVARALLEWRVQGPKAEIDRALARAIVYLKDDSHLNPYDKDELIWAYVYRLNFFSRLMEEDKKNAEKHATFLQKLVTATESFQLEKSGAYRHEYAAAFTSASVIHALFVAKAAGARVSKPRLKAATKAIAGARVKKTGAFGYGLRNRGGVEQAGGRMALCELALYLGGVSSEKKLKDSIAEGFKQQGNFEIARNYDDHMRSLYGIGGFFFWYDMHGRAEAIRLLKGQKAAKWREAMRKIVYDTHEADGGWIDSHELGKSYGTAMALTVLKLMQELEQ